MTADKLMLEECFTCGDKRRESEFQYTVHDRQTGSRYFACDPQCLKELGESELENDDYLDYMTDERKATGL